MHGNDQVNLKSMARKCMVENDFLPDQDAATKNEVRALQRSILQERSTAASQDLRNLLWSSIDNTESKDLDQIEVVENPDNGNARILVGIADVDACVPKGCAIDRWAAHNTTSIYTGITTFPMLPQELSTNITSLLQDDDRQAVVIDMNVTNDGSLQSTEIYEAVVRNHAKLAYDPVGDWLEHNGTPPQDIPDVQGLPDQLKLQWKEAERLRALRIRAGALNLASIEVNAITEKDQVIDLVTVDTNPARDLIENFMVAANTAIATFLENKGLTSIRRIVRTPERWSRIVQIAAESGAQLPEQPDAKALSLFLTKQKSVDPVHFPDLSLSIIKLLGPGEYVVVTPGKPHEGHFGLAVHDYTHSTAPNRRYVDLIMQRLLKATIRNQPSPYNVDELEQIAAHCTERESAARKVERFMRKVSAAVFLSKRIGDQFDAIVTGIKPDGTYVRLIKPAAEGRLVHGQQGIDVGDKIRVRLVSTNPVQGYIDFDRVKSS